MRSPFGTPTLARFVLIGLGIALAAHTQACTDEAEGQPCSIDGVTQGDDECQPNLTCTEHQDLSGSYTKDVCCPTNRALATTLICQQGSGDLGDAAAPADAADDSAAAIDSGAVTDSGASVDSGSGTDSGSFNDGAADSAARDGAPGDSASSSDAHAEGG